MMPLDRSAYNREYRARNREKLLAQDKERYLANREERCIKERSRYHANKHLFADRTEYHKRWYSENKEHIQTLSKRWYAANREKVLANQRARYAMVGPEKLAKARAKYDPQKSRARGRMYYEANYEKSAARAAKRRARKIGATPFWLTKKQINDIESVYEAAKVLSERGHETYVVDHIVPLQGIYVCGLHVRWNLQILTFEENASKRNYLPAVDQLVDYSAKGYTGVRTRLKRALKGKK